MSAKKGSRPKTQITFTQSHDDTCARQVDVKAWADLFALLLEMKIDQEDTKPKEFQDVEILLKSKM